MILCHLVVHGRAGALSAVSRIILNNRAIYLTDQLRNQSRVQVVACRRLAGGQLHSNLVTNKLRAKSRVYIHQGLRTDIRCEIHSRFPAFILMFQRRKPNHLAAVGPDTLCCNSLPILLCLYTLLWSCFRTRNVFCLTHRL